MSPTRLRESGDALACALIAAAREEAPPAGMEERALVALGIAAASSDVGAASSPSTSAIATHATSESVRAVFLKCLGILGVMVTFAALPMAASRSPVVATRARATVGTRVDACLDARGGAEEQIDPSHVASVLASASRDADRSPVRLRTPALPVARVTLAPSSIAPTSSAPPMLPAAYDESELMLVRVAKAQVARRDFREALTTLDRHRAAFPRGAFTQEAELLRIRALSGSGARASVTKAAEKFIETYPRSTYLESVRPFSE
jgi:hypothetical protein